MARRGSPTEAHPSWLALALVIHSFWQRPNQCADIAYHGHPRGRELLAQVTRDKCVPASNWNAAFRGAHEKDEGERSVSNHNRYSRPRHCATSMQALNAIGLTFSGGNGLAIAKRGFNRVG